MVKNAMITESNKALAGSLAVQIELSQELARIALECPTCRGLFRKTIIRFRKNKNKSSDFSSQEESQTEFVNPNNNDLEDDVSREVDVSDGINTH
jgi:hypothetical protein